MKKLPPCNSHSESVVCSYVWLIDNIRRHCELSEWPVHRGRFSIFYNVASSTVSIGLTPAQLESCGRWIYYFLYYEKKLSLFFFNVIIIYHYAWRIRSFSCCLYTPENEFLNHVQLSKIFIVKTFFHLILNKIELRWVFTSIRKSLIRIQNVV